MSLILTLGQHQEQFSRHLVQLIQFAYIAGYEVRIGEVERTLEQQRIYKKSGRSKTLDSMHLKKCAADLHFTKDGSLTYPSAFGDFWESLDLLNRWGGHWDSFKDFPHFQRTV